MPAVNPQSSYLLLEDSGHIILENGSGFILLENQPAAIEYLGGMPHKYDAKHYRWMNRRLDAKYIEIERQKLGILPAPAKPQQVVPRIEIPETAVIAPQISQKDVTLAIINANQQLQAETRLRQEIERLFRADLQIKQMRLEQAILDQEDEENAIAILLLH